MPIRPIDGLPATDEALGHTNKIGNFWLPEQRPPRGNTQAQKLNGNCCNCCFYGCGCGCCSCSCAVLLPADRKLKAHAASSKSLNCRLVTEVCVFFICICIFIFGFFFLGVDMRYSKRYMYAARTSRTCLRVCGRNNMWA